MKTRWYRALSLGAALVVVAGMVGCDGREDRTHSPPAAVVDAPDPNEQEAPLSDMELTHVRSSDALQGQGSPVQFKASGAALSTEMSSYTVYLNDSIVDGANLLVQGDQLTMTSALKNGRNQVLVYAPDAQGAPIEARASIWAGTAPVQGRVVDEAGNPVVGATVVGSLADDSKVTATTTTDSAGRYVLRNFPSRTVIVTATGSGDLSGSTAGVAGTEFPNLVFWNFGIPVTPNLDFSRGTEGWINHNGVPPTLEDYVENPGPKSALPSPASYSQFMRWSPFSTAHAQAVTRKSLRLSTSGMGPITTSHTFIPPADAKTFRMRYRFQTTEFPTYFGSAYNDAFQITLNSKGGQKAVERGSMNELGAAAFDSSGSTAWKDLTLELAAAGSPVRVEVTLANVKDGAMDSVVIIDHMQPSSLSITQARLFDIDNSTLQYLSATDHPYFGATTRVHATLKLMGPAAAKLSSLELHVQQDGVVKARGQLATSLNSKLYKPFGASGIELSAAQLAFEIPAKELAAVNSTHDGPLKLKLVAKADDGSTAEKEMGQVPLLVRWTGGERYGGRDAHRGGDDWLTAATRDICSSVNASWGDFSNMNAGSFAPDHRSHTSGGDADGWYSGYSARDAAAAAKMIAMLNTPGVGKKVKLVYVSHTPRPRNAFYDAYKDVTLADGRRADHVIRNYAGHDTHFHWSMPGLEG
ncbi:carboxypeptidase-like regulatory domain-containing protein [Comamonas antarctica]|uniref:Carboxypeptidase regulatory-like domain-containing protein n=1 Tax=Comamonas antarctica TaxID=2743470 RepID=A0A6N1X951_9BURK|nr:carboxypeptidase-like regulatory domain-containing protein [Comamonas antarctica]QKV54873.1 carboxypeptidase regulatory-like domain-containing protein [Comamonas antarctica]